MTVDSQSEKSIDIAFEFLRSAVGSSAVLELSHQSCDDFVRAGRCSLAVRSQRPACRAFDPLE